jgi:hypothetical protein
VESTPTCIDLQGSSGMGENQIEIERGRREILLELCVNILP